VAEQGRERDQGRAAPPLELTLDLRGTPPDKVLARLLGALERVSDDVTLVALVRDTPDYAAPMASVYSTLRQRGYWSDSSRFPAGVQRLRVGRRREYRAGRAVMDGAPAEEPAYAPAPSGGPVEG
jgi:hypothetical protein